MDVQTLGRDVSAPLSTNPHLLRWVRKMADLAKPKSIHWVDGSREEYDLLCEQMVQSGTLTRLNQDLWPGCFYARSDPNDVARVESRTYVCSLSKDNAGPTNNWVNPYEMHARLKEMFSGAMAGRTMYVLAFSMADGLNQLGVPGWIAQRSAASLAGWSAVTIAVLLIALFFVLHYLFASTTAHGET